YAGGWLPSPPIAPRSAVAVISMALSNNALSTSPATVVPPSSSQTTKYATGRDVHSTTPARAGGRARLGGVAGTSPGRPRRRGGGHAMARGRFGAAPVRTQSCARCEAAGLVAGHRRATGPRGVQAGRAGPVRPRHG